MNRSSLGLNTVGSGGGEILVFIMCNYELQVFYDGPNVRRGNTWF